MADSRTTRQSKRSPVTLKIKFKSATLDQFIERYSVDVSHGGIFIRTKDPLPVGTAMRFEFQLRDASPLITGEGTVVWTREHDPTRAGVAPGMGVRFDKLTEGSQQVLDQILSQKSKGSAGKSASSGFGDVPTRVAPSPLVAGLAKESQQSAHANFTEERTDSTPLPKPMPFHSDADDFPEEAFEEATKVRSLDDLVASSALQESELKPGANEAGRSPHTVKRAETNEITTVRRREPTPAQGVPAMPSAGKAPREEDDLGLAPLSGGVLEPMPASGISLDLGPAGNEASPDDEADMDISRDANLALGPAGEPDTPKAPARGDDDDDDEIPQDIIDELAARRAAKQAAQGVPQQDESLPKETSGQTSGGIRNIAAAEATPEPGRIEVDGKPAVLRAPAARDAAGKPRGVDARQEATAKVVIPSELQTPDEQPAQSRKGLVLALVLLLLVAAGAAAFYVLSQRGERTDSSVNAATDQPAQAAGTDPALTDKPQPGSDQGNTGEPAAAAGEQKAPDQPSGSPGSPGSPDSKDPTEPEEIEIEPDEAAAAAVPDADAKKVAVEVRSEPPGATVELGDQSGKAPMKLQVAEGRTHTARVSLDGYATKEVTIDPSTAAKSPVKVVLQPMPWIMRMTTTPEGATVYVEGRRVPGLTPNEFVLPKEFLKKPRFKVSLRLAGYDKLDLTVERTGFQAEGESMVLPVTGTMPVKPVVAPQPKRPPSRSKPQPTQDPGSTGTTDGAQDTSGDSAAPPAEPPKEVAPPPPPPSGGAEAGGSEPPAQ